MTTFQHSLLTEIAIHHAGSKPSDLFISENTTRLPDEEDVKRMVRHFTRGFLMDAPNQFVEKDGIVSETANLMMSVFQNEMSFFEGTVRLTEIYQQFAVKHHEGSGEIIFCKFEIPEHEDQVRHSGIGFYITEGRTDFLQLDRANNTYSMSLNEGIPLKKMPRAVLFLYDEKEGLRLLFRKWDPGISGNPFREEFLQCRPVVNDYHYTASHLSLMKSYMDQEMEEEDKLSRIDALNKSLTYLQENDHFDMNEFESKVFEDPEQVRSFDEFRKNYTKEHDLDIVDEFDISQGAVKKSQRYIRSVIKLDKNFHVYVHGNKQNIVRGYDTEKDMYFYTLYFREES